MLTFEQYIGAREHKSRTQKVGTDLSKNYLRKHQNFVPDYRKTDNTKIPKVERLKRKRTGREVLNHHDVKRIFDMYNISDLSPTNPRRLGNTGISIMFNQSTGKFILQK